MPIFNIGENTMKTQVITEQLKFQPVTVQLTFESQKELDVLKYLLGFNVGIPDQIFPSDPVKALQLSAIMEELHDLLLQADSNNRILKD
jgi:hypothetical protein